ncbi:MAG: hypothetical protein QOJ64_3997 [Acidobacteriota bacterium]|nr:hypothetical protein [Acidobacteriota bacterium]
MFSFLVHSFLALNKYFRPLADSPRLAVQRNREAGGFLRLFGMKVLERIIPGLALLSSSCLAHLLFHIALDLAIRRAEDTVPNSHRHSKVGTGDLMMDLVVCS